MKRILLVVSIIVVLVIGGIVLYMYWPSPAYTPVITPEPQEPSGQTISPPAPGEPTGQIQAEADIKVGGNEVLGAFLTATDGMTLYTFKNDQPGISNCAGQCLVIWPPLVLPDTSATPAAGIMGEVGTIRRSDGSYQATYNGWPLYLYLNDRVPGDAFGEGVNDVWFVVKP